MRAHATTRGTTSSQRAATGPTLFISGSAPPSRNLPTDRPTATASDSAIKVQPPFTPMIVRHPSYHVSGSAHFMIITVHVATTSTNHRL